MKSLYIIIGCGLLFAVCALTITLYGKAEYKQGYTQALLDKKTSENAALIQQAKAMVDSFEQTQASIKELWGINDDSDASPVVGFAIDRMRQQRASNGLQSPPAPSTKPAIQK